MRLDFEFLVSMCATYDGLRIETARRSLARDSEATYKLESDLSIVVDYVIEFELNCWEYDDIIDKEEDIIDVATNNIRSQVRSQNAEQPVYRAALAGIRALAEFVEQLAMSAVKQAVERPDKPSIPHTEISPRLYDSKRIQKGIAIIADGLRQRPLYRKLNFELVARQAWFRISKEMQKNESPILMQAARSPRAFWKYVSVFVWNEAREMILRKEFANDEGSEIGSLAATAEALITESNRDIIFLNNFKNLSEKQRWCILVHYFYNVPVNEIAGKMGISEATIYSRLEAARKILRADSND